jgi:hypothetical protein
MSPTRLRPPPSRSSVTMLDLAQTCLIEAAAAERPAERYVAAHLAALRGAAAVLASRAHAGAGRPRRPVSAWALLGVLAPELAEWAAFFAAGAATRQAAEAGATGVVTQRDADDLLRDAETFLAVVAATIEPAPWRGIPVG